MVDHRSKEIYDAMLDDVRGKLARLESDGSFNQALSADKLRAIEKYIGETPEIDLRYDNWLPAFLYVERNTIEQLLAMETDIKFVESLSDPSRVNEVGAFLKARKRAGRQWLGGFFDLYVKTKISRSAGKEVVLDPITQGGRRADVKFPLGTKSIGVECTVLTESDEDIKTWDAYTKDKKLNPNILLTRPGKYDKRDEEEDSEGEDRKKQIGPSPYHNCIRLYTKVYEKIAPGADPSRSQLFPDIPNILLISVNSAKSLLGADSLEVGWALDELFADQPRGLPRNPNEEQFVDISLSGFVQYAANELIKQEKLTEDQFAKDMNAIYWAPRQIAAIFLFDRCRFVKSRINYNAIEVNRITHHDMAELESLLGETSPHFNI